MILKVLRPFILIISLSINISQANVQTQICISRFHMVEQSIADSSHHLIPIELLQSRSSYWPHRYLDQDHLKHSQQQFHFSASQTSIADSIFCFYPIEQFSPLIFYWLWEHLKPFLNGYSLLSNWFAGNYFCRFPLAKIQITEQDYLDQISQLSKYFIETRLYLLQHHSGSKNIYNCLDQCKVQREIIDLCLFFHTQLQPNRVSHPKQMSKCSQLFKSSLTFSQPSQPQTIGQCPRGWVSLLLFSTSRNVKDHFIGAVTLTPMLCL